MKKLQHYKKLVRRIKGNLDLLEKHGFVRCDLASCSASTKAIYINYARGVVIKRSFLIEPKKPRRAIPTAVVYMPLSQEEKDNLDQEDRNKWDRILIQPLAICDNLAQELAFKSLCESYGGYDFSNDSHEGNVGFYRGKAVVIDW